MFIYKGSKQFMVAVAIVLKSYMLQFTGFCNIPRTRVLLVIVDSPFF